MDESRVKTNSLRAWVLAARPKTLSGAAVPVMVGAAMAWADTGRLEWLPCLLCLLFALVMQVDANLVNDYFDYRRGNDDAETRLGPPRACSMGWVTPRAMLRAIGVTTAIGCMVGLPLAWIGGWPLVGVGVACVVFCFLYTTCLSYLGMGDVLVLVFFGLVPVCLTYYLVLPVSLRTVTPTVVMMALSCGLVIDTLLLVNNYRDIDNDRRDHKRTLVVMVGRRWGSRFYLVAGLVAMMMTWFTPWLWVVVFVTSVYVPGHLSAYGRMRRLEGRELNRVLAHTARNMLVYGLCVAAGAVMSRLWG